MTDYTHATGSSGTMMIRDTGTTVEFWLKAGSATFNHALSWGYYVNGAWSTYRNFDFKSGGAYQKLGAVSVSTDQTVGFRIAASGTSGLGGPTTFTVSIDRTTVPPAPTAPVLANVTGTTMVADTDNRGNGGLPILQYQIGYSTSSSGASSFITASSSGVANLTGLAKGTTYYVWGRVRNAKGWSAWSPRSSAKTWIEPPAPTIPVVVAGPTQNSVTVKFSSNGGGGAIVWEYQIAFDVVNPPVNAMTAPMTGLVAFSGLTAGRIYYFRVRARNAVGWGAWSGVLAVQLKAGANVKIGGVWKKAVPYVNVGGVWKVAQPYVKIAGLWKETR